MSDQITADPAGTDLVPAGDAAVPTVPAGGAIKPARPAHAHPDPRQYVLIAVVLVVITGFEVATSYLEGDINSNLLITALGIMAVFKFFLVTGWFMHLRTDSKIFRRMFLLGLITAPIVYTIMLLVLHFAAY